MTAPVQKKFKEEFEIKKPKKSCLGFLRGRKVKKHDETIYFSPLCRSPHIDGLNLLNSKRVVK